VRWEEVLTFPVPHLCVQKSALCYTILLAEFPRLPIVETDRVRFRKHERSTCADKHGDNERNESIPHDKNGNGG